MRRSNKPAARQAELQVQLQMVIEQLTDAQALVQRLMVERSVLEAELRGYESGRREEKP